MKSNIKILIFITMLLCSTAVWAQDNTANQTMKTINEALSQGDCERAQRAYNVWKVLTESTDSLVESRIKSCQDSKKQAEQKKNEETKRKEENKKNDFFTFGHLDCFVYMKGTRMDWNTSNAIAQSSVVGGYSDWRLPTMSELFIILQQRKEMGWYPKYVWSSEVYQGKNKKTKSGQIRHNVLDVYYNREKVLPYDDDSGGNAGECVIVRENGK
jgi:hypothetical protein